MKSNSITIKDIAKMLGMSKSTISRALTEHSDVNAETRKQILEVAQKLNYQPNSLALALKQQRTNTIGVIVPETVNRFFAKAIGGIERVANVGGYNVVICQSNESVLTEKSNLLSLVNARVDGILVSVSSETKVSDNFLPLLQKQIPLVFFDRIIEEVETSMVHTDNYEISFKGTEHLILQGCKKIAIIAGPQNLSNSRNRLSGYIDALKRYNIPVDESMIVHSHFRGASVEDYSKHLMNLSPRPDAVFAINDYAAIEMIHLFKKNNIRVPNDIAVLGFNNDRIGRFIEPALSTIDVSAFDIGSAAAEILVQHIKNPNQPIQRRLIRSQLIVRESSLFGGKTE
jgi:DNA-binding LacI/PurR family transcriptional regulator